jgi:hypothetical protein
MVPEDSLVVPVAEARETIARAITAQLVLYTLPANVNAYHRGQTAEEIAVRCGPLMADAVLAALAPTSEGGRDE